MTIVYKTGQVSATPWTDFGPILTLKPVREPCYSAFEPGLLPDLIRVDAGSREESASELRLCAEWGVAA
jgi:hypothetical protein